MEALKFRPPEPDDMELQERFWRTGYDEKMGFRCLDFKIGYCLLTLRGESKSRSTQSTGTY
jgi:hypothetical protein